MSKNSRIRDNNGDRTVAAFLKDKIQPGSSLSIVSAYFSIYAFDKLRTSLEGIDDLRFLFGEPAAIGGMDQSKTESKAFELTESGLRLENYLTQSEIAKACVDWIKEKKVEIQSATRSNFLHGKMYYIDSAGKVDALIGSSNFTVRGLGLSKNASNIELNLEVDSKSDCADLKDWFDDLWESDEVEDVKEQVLKTLEDAYKDRDPEFIYYKTLFHLFEDFITKANDPEFADANPRFHRTKIWQELYLFQRHGVQACLQKLKAYNGCIIADSVGLGKTYEALAIIKYFELRNANVLVLCPKKLEENWLLYPRHYGRRNNPFKEDQFRYRVLSHTDLGRDSGESNGIKFAQHEWDGYDLIVIDESHNFRNRGMRYNKLMEDVIQSGCQTKVLMLSATPVNNQFTDLENQICLITGDKDDAFKGIKEVDIQSIKGTLKTAQTRFDTWMTNSEGSNSQENLSERLNADFFRLLDRLTIARSQRHVKDFYINTKSKTDRESGTDKELGEFPEPEKPKSISSEIDVLGRFPTYQVISEQIDGYKLSLFNPSRYIREECQHHYGGRLHQREFNLIGMMKVNFLKRLESSIYSFATTLERTLKKIEIIESGITEFLNADEKTIDENNFDLFTEEEEENEEDEDLQAGIHAGRNQTYHYEHLDLDAWLTDLEHDRTQLEKIYAIANNITTDRDAKLEQLKQLIAAKVQCPTTNRVGKKNRKVLVFTAFADTANYLYDNLHTWVTQTLDIQCAVVTGSKNDASFGGRDFNEILTNFSPISKDRGNLRPRDDDAQGAHSAIDNEQEIDLLIATDCISEGQNLQDCDYLINYDIHWNPVRIIQRFGRINRIGSHNTKIQLVNFWPTPELEEYINLRTRVEARMLLVDITATADDDILSLRKKAKPIWTHRDDQLKRMQTKVLELEDVEEHLNINQFTLDDFRAQLLNYLGDDRDKLKNAPLGLYAVTRPQKHSGETVDIDPGVIFCLKQSSTTEENEKLNPIHPYYLVYISNERIVSIGFTNPKQILGHLSALCSKKETHNSDLCDQFNKETASGREMKVYNVLLQEVLDSIRKEYSRTVNDQMDASGADFLLPTAEEQVTETTEFELITWLVIKE